MYFTKALSLKVAVLLLFGAALVPYTISLEDGPRLEGESIRFQRLPEGIPYKTEIPPSQWMLSSYEEIARKFSLALRSDPPYGALKEVIKERQFTDRAYDEALEYEIPFLGLASISLLSFIIIPLTGLIFFCCRCCGQCGGRLEEEDMNFSPVKQRQRLSVAIALCSVLILIGSSCIFLSSDRLGASIPLVNTVLQDSLDDVIAYKNNTIKQLEVIVGPDMKFAASLVENDLNSISAHVAKPVMVEARKLVRPILEAISDYGKTIVVVGNLLGNVNATVNELQQLGTTLRYRLNETRQNLTEVRKSCDDDRDAKRVGICDKIPNGDELTPVADFTKVPDVSSELNKVKKVISIDISLEAEKGNESFEKIPDDIANTTQSGRQDIINVIRDLEDLLSTMVSDLKNTSNQMIESTVIPLKNNIDSLLGRDGVAMEYDNYRFLGLLSLACAILFVMLLTYCGLSAGIFGARDYDTPSTRSLLADYGGRTLMCSAACFFLLSLFINLLLGVLFLLGSNMTVLCTATKDLTLIEKTIDDPSVHGHFPLSKAILNNGTIDVRISHMLRGCGNGETPWKLLKLSSRFDLNNFTNYKDKWRSDHKLDEAINKAIPSSFKIPSMAEIFEQLNATVTNVSVITAELDKNLNDSIAAGVHSIKFDRFRKQMEQPLVAVSVFKFALNLSALSDEAEPTSKAIADNLRVLSTRLDNIQNDIIETSIQLVRILKAKVKKLEDKANETLATIQEVYGRVKDLEIFLATDALSLANKASNSYLNRILGWVDQYLQEATRKVRNQVGKCSCLKKAFDASTSALCENFLSPVNSLWLSFGTIAVFSIISIILCVHLAKHYRRAHRSSRSSKHTTYGVPLSVFTKSMASRPRRTTVNPWRRVNKNTPVPKEIDTLRWV